MMVEFLKNLQEKQERRPIRIVFVCTANCCRSPMAEIIFEKLLIDELGSIDKVVEKNILVESAATSYSGFTIADKSAQILITEEGIKAARCKAHKGRLLSEIDEPDLVLTMGSNHQSDINIYFPWWNQKVYTLEQFVKFDKKLPAHDIKDPIGGTDDDFKKIKDHIKENLLLLFNEFKQAGLI